MIYRIEFGRQAAKDIKRLGPKAVEALLVLETHPEAGEALSGNLAGFRSLHFTLKGSGQYRAIYEVHGDICLCMVIAVGSRENFYRDAERIIRSRR